jgi:hypothetical protein
MLRINPVLVFLAAITVYAGDEPPAAQEVKALNGTVYRGSLTHITEQEIHLRSDDKEVKLLAADVLSVELQAAKALPNSAFVEIGLMDGSRLRCQSFTIKAKSSELRLLNGQALPVPLEALRYILSEANVEAKRKEFEPFLAKPDGPDVLRLQSRDGPGIVTFEGFLGGADAQGETIHFKPEDGDAVQVSLARVRGIVFNRNPPAMPKAIARVYDTSGDAIVVAKVSTQPTAYHLETPTGITFDLPMEITQRFDFSLGKLAYLSDLEPLKSEGELIVAVTPLWTRDRHLEGGPISLNRKTHAKGLAVHARCVLEYDVTGYHFFRCILGIDDAMEGMGQALVRIDGDGKELFTTPISSKDEPKQVELKIAGMSKLRLTVDYGEDGDLGAHVDFAEARVMK